MPSYESKPLSIRFSPAQLALIDDVARQMRVSRSIAVRALITAALADDVGRAVAWEYTAKLMAVRKLLTKLFARALRETVDATIQTAIAEDVFAMRSEDIEDLVDAGISEDEADA